MRIGSLFSGIGGLELGLERAGLGHTVWQVERDEFCRRVLAKHWPDAERFDDVLAVGAAQLRRVDLICGGFPCQDVSSAGLRKGLTGERSGLWREFARVVSELRPGWVVVENVTSGASAWVDAIVRELEQLGYACLPVPLSAFDVGAPHRRARVFIIACDHDERDANSSDALLVGRAGRIGQENKGREAESPDRSAARSDQTHADAYGDQLRDQRWRSGGQGRDCSQVAANDGQGSGSDPDGARREGPRTDEENAGREGLASRAWRPPIPNILRVADGISRGLDSPRRRIKALGNAVVPQCAEVVGWIIKELSECENR